MGLAAHIKNREEIRVAESVCGGGGGGGDKHFWPYYSALLLLLLLLLTITLLPIDYYLLTYFCLDCLFSQHIKCDLTIKTV